jgi:hypothetical protein
MSRNADDAAGPSTSLTLPLRPYVPLWVGDVVSPACWKADKYHPDFDAQDEGLEGWV